MFITRLIKQVKNTITVLDSETISLNQVKEESILSSCFYLEVCPDTTEPCVILNLSLLLLETEVGKCSTWTEVLSMINSVILESYWVILPDFDRPTSAVRSISPLSEEGFTLSYLDMDVPEDRDIKQFRESMKDLGIRKTGEISRFDLNHCLCSVNGMISRPVMFNDEMLLKDGAKFMWSTTDILHPNLMLLDFSDFGGFEIIPFSSCEKKFKNYNNHPDFQTEIKMILPENTDLSDCTVFTVINHTLFFPTDIKIVNKRTIVVTPGLYRLNMSMLKKSAVSSDFVYNTYVNISDQKVKTYVEETMFSPEEFGAFFVVVKSRDLWIKRTSISNFVDSVDNYKSELDGFLFDRTTQSVIDGTVIKYDHVHDYYRQPLASVMHFDAQIEGDEVKGIQSTKCAHSKDALRDFSQASLEVIKIVGK